MGLTVGLLVPMVEAMRAASAIWSIGTPSRGLTLSGGWALERLLRDVQGSFEVRALDADVLSLATQLVENSTSDRELITWRRLVEPSTGESWLERAVTLHVDEYPTVPVPLPPVTYARDVTAFELRGPRLWTKLDGDGDVLAPQLGPRGTVTNGPRYAGGVFGNAAQLRAQGESIAFPLTPGVLLNASTGTIEFWFDLSLARSVTGVRYLLDTSEASDGQRLSITYTGPSGRVAVLWRGVEVLAFTPNPLELGLTHLAVVWDGSGASLGTDDAGGILKTALYYAGRRVDASTAGPPAGDFEGYLYVGSSNTPNGVGSGQAGVPIDNLKVHDTPKTRFGSRWNENDLGLVDVTLSLRREAGNITLRGAAGVQAGRPVQSDVSSRPPPPFPFVLQSEGSIDCTPAATTKSWVFGFVHANGSFVPGAPPYLPIFPDGQAMVSSGRPEPFYVPNMASYRAVADPGQLILGPKVFVHDTSYAGVWYVTGKVTIESGVKVKGTIVGEKGIYRQKSGQYKTENVSIVPDRSGLPALIAVGRSPGSTVSIDLSHCANILIRGLVYGDEGVDLSHMRKLRMRGVVLSGGAAHTLDFGRPNNSSIAYSLLTTPPFFSPRP
ncbi:MAG: hypothetical protein HY814_06920 [Candidatus Riflebacteria bacterium]|nr:hypothetical protein [Candidatus Riflebacteria bacterium]